MPKKSTKVVDANVSTPEVVHATAPAVEPAVEPDTKKRAPAKRVSKKINVANTNDKDANTLPTTNATIQTAVQPSIQVSDSVNTFNIHIKHVSDDGSNIENTFSTTYTHTSRESDEDDGKDKNSNSNSNSNSDSDSDSGIDSDSDKDSDYDKKFISSSLSLPSSSKTDVNSLLALASVFSVLPEYENPLYTTQLINYDILIPFVLVNMHASSRENIMALLHNTLISCIEGRCITEGFIKPHSTRIIDFKCGKIIAKNVQFNIVIECLVCNPHPQSIIRCVAKNITQAGIRAVSDDEYSPIVVYITRDFGIESDKMYYHSIKEGDNINIKVIGKRFEINDKHIQIIGFLVHPKNERYSINATPCSKKKSTASMVPVTRVDDAPVNEPTPMISATKTDTNAKESLKKHTSRKTKNPLSIVNDTNNNVITITYDVCDELPKKSNSKSAKKVKNINNSVDTTATTTATTTTTTTAT